MLILECESVRALQEYKYSILSCTVINSHTDRPGSKRKNEGRAIHDTSGVSYSHAGACGQLELTYANSD